MTALGTTSSPRRLRVLLWLTLGIVFTSTVSNAARAETSRGLDVLLARPGILGTVPLAPSWSPDGGYLAFSWAAPGELQRGLWLIDRTGSDLERIDRESGGALRAFIWKDPDTLLLLRGDELRALDRRSGEERTLQRVGGAARDLAQSPDGRHVSYLRDGDLWLFTLATGQERPLTAVGLPPLSATPTGRYSRAEREIGPGVWGGPTYAWSSDSKTIAVHHVDRRGMRKVLFPNYLASDTTPNWVRRGYPGDDNEARRVGLVDIDRGTLDFLTLDDPKSHQIIDFEWSGRGDLLVDTATDTASRRRLYTVTAGSREPGLFWESQRASRIYTNFAARWTPDSQGIILLSDHEDRYGLYRLPFPKQAADKPTRLDDPTDDVLGPPRVTASAVYFEADGGNPANRQIFRFDAGGKPRQLTADGGHHIAYPSPQGDAVAFIRSDDRHPPELYMLSPAADTARQITNSPLPAFADFPLAQSRYLTTTGGDHPSLGIRLLLPADFDATRRYPVLFGPMYSNTVRNRWNSGYTPMQHALTQRGYLVAQVDVRGSTGYGRAFREAFLNDFAGRDIEDIERAVTYLKSLPYVDGKRLGIWGSSYGGTLTVYTLLQKPGLFAAGVAAAAAVDPAFFGTDDVAIVGHPADQSGIFDRRAEALADRLEDPLLLVHGLQDQVVPFKTVASLTDALLRAGKYVETAFLPGATHGWRREPPYDRYVFQRLLEFFDRHLKPDSSCP